MTDVLVVGGGIIGCSVALELAERGAYVTVLEANEPGTGATGASAGMIAPQYETTDPGPLFRFGAESRRAWPAFGRRLEELSGWAVDFRQDGMLVANHTEEEDAGARRAAGWQRDQGHAAEVLDLTDARRIHGGVSGDPVSWLWLPDEAQVNAQLLASGLASAVAGTAAELRVGHRVAGITRRDGRLRGIRTRDGGEADADVVVLAAGAWSSRLDGLPRTLAVRPVRGQILRLRPASAVPWPLVADHQGHYVVPRRNDAVLAGSTMEEASFDDSVTEQGREEIAERACSLVPGLAEAEIVESWAGLRPISADGLPVLGPDPDLDGLFYATGHGRNGILLAPLTARVVADLVVEGRSPVAWRPFSARRLPGGDPDRSDGDGA